MDINKLNQLHELYEKGAITETEYQTQKETLLHDDDNALFSLGLKENGYCAIMNFSLLLSFLGCIIALLFWYNGKDKSARVNQLGYYLANFELSFFIYALIGVLLSLLTLDFLVWVIGIVYTVIIVWFGIKLLNNEPLVSYPLAIPFIKKN